MPVFTVWLKPFYRLEGLSLYVLVTVHCVGNDLLPGCVACIKFRWGLSLRLPCLDLRRAHVRFMVDRMVLVLVFSEYFGFLQ